MWFNTSKHQIRAEEYAERAGISMEQLNLLLQGKLRDRCLIIKNLTLVDESTLQWLENARNSSTTGADTVINIVNPEGNASSAADLRTMINAIDAKTYAERAGVTEEGLEHLIKDTLKDSCFNFGGQVYIDEATLEWFENARDF